MHANRAPLWQNGATMMQIPGDKSISHRALILSAIAEGTTRIHDILNGQDCKATAKILQNMGVSMKQEGDITEVVGVGLHGLQEPSMPLDCGNSGTSMRLLAGLLAAQSFDSELIGDASLSRRPMARIVEPLNAMGAKISMSSNKTAPLKIKGGQSLSAINYTLPVASAQVKSGLLLASLYAKDQCHIVDPFNTRDHTERMLKLFQYNQNDFLQSPRDIRVPGDISSAAFFVVAAAVMPGADFLLQNIGVNPTRTGIIQNLKAMGADIILQNKRFLSNEPVADIRIRYTPLSAITLNPDNIVNCIDEFPILFIAAACANGTSVFENLHELRVKESDRIATMAAGLKALGVSVVEKDSSMAITGGPIQSGIVDARSDHRVAMAFAIAQTVATGQIQIKNCDTVATSFPDFWKCYKAIRR